MRPSILQLLCCGLNVLFPLVAIGATSLAVVDEHGEPIEHFEVMVHTADEGYENWQPGNDGSLALQSVARNYAKSAAIDFVVRADGYASVLRTFQGPAKDEMARSGARIVMEHGREVRLKLRPPAGMQFPDGLFPQVYFPELAWRVEIMWQPENSHVPQSDFNMLNVRPAKDAAGEYVFRLPHQQHEFVVAIFHPGWLRFFKAGPFTASDFTDGVMTIEIPRPTTIEAKFEWGELDQALLPFTAVHYRLMRQLHAGGNSYLSAATEKRTLDDPLLRVTDVGPGHYILQLFTEPKNPKQIRTGTEIDPGRFFARKEFDVLPGQTVSESFEYERFDPGANRGQRTARLRVIGADGDPAAGKRLKVGWFDGHYGSLTVFDGPIPEDGLVMLDGISDAVPTEAPFGPYSVEVEGESLGFFRVKPQTQLQEFTFRMVPKAGDTATDVELVTLESGANIRLSDLRGKVVFLEFWETGCGPCQPMMAKLNELMASHGGDWNNEVAILPVGLDANPDIIKSHVSSRGWTNLRHYWSKRTGDEYFADAAIAFVVHGVPTALLIDREGKIVWRGHPSSIDLPAEIAKLELDDAFGATSP